jgi:hypothetical protein
MTKDPKSWSWMLAWLSWGLIGLGIVTSIVDHWARWYRGFPYDPGVGLGIIAMIAAGVVAAVGAISIKKVEGRLHRIEDDHRRALGKSN